MKKDNPIGLLQENITVIAFKQEEDLVLLNRQLEVTFDSLKPANLIKSAIINMTSVSGLKSTLASNTVGLTTGYFSKKIVLRGTHNPVKKFLGNVLMFIITNVVAKKNRYFSIKKTQKNSGNHYYFFIT